MCGIGGFVGFKDDDLLWQMAESLSHRGPDAEGLYSSTEASLAHRRLAIIDLSIKGKQPMFNEDKTVVLVFNGEIFNFQEIRDDLIKRGHLFKSRTDTETIVHGYEEWGIKKTVERLRGFFAFALWDKKKKTLYLVRDRIGVKPLYYYQKDEKLVFASEIKAILEDTGIKRKVNENQYWQYLTFQASMGEETMFAGINKVPPATIIKFSRGKITKEHYWELKKDFSISKLTDKEKSDRFKELLLESIKIRLISDVPLGVLLSGGLDSSAIVALMASVGAKPIKTFSAGFGEPDDELKYARMVADRYKTDHQELIIKPKEIKEVLKKIVWHQDEPLADGGGIATYLVAKEVSRQVKVVLIGEGGDELFGGYSWYKLGLPVFNFVPEEVKKRIYYYLTTFSRQNTYSYFENRFKKGKGNFLDRMVKYEVNNILPNSLCMKVDKMTSAFGLEAREPFLDHKLAEFCFSLSVDDRIATRQSKVLFRRLMADMLPTEILERKKHGFLLPTGKWLNGELKPWTKEILLDTNSQARIRFTQREIEKLFIPRKLLAEYERINLLWRLLLFELWYSIYFQ